MKRSLVLLSLMMVGLAGCTAIKELTNFTKCKFRYTNITQTQLAGIDVTRIRQYNDLSLKDAGTVSKYLLKGDLPLSFTINLQATNPNDGMAALNSVQWIAFIENTEIANGNMNSRVEIAPGATETIPLTVSTDLLDYFNKGSAAEKAFNLADANGNPKTVGIKIKPTINVAGFNFAYPGYITLSKDFKAE